MRQLSLPAAVRFDRRLLPPGQTRITSGLNDHRIARTSLRVGASTSQVTSAAIASSITAMNSCSVSYTHLTLPTSDLV